MSLPEATEFNLAAIVREALASDVADPHLIAKHLIDTFDERDLRSALAATLPDYVRKMNHRAMLRQTTDSTPRSSRWDGVARHHEDGTLALLRIRVFARSRWLFLGDCEQEDVTALADDRESEARANSAAAKRFRVLRATMNEADAAMVRDLPRDVLEAIFNA